MNKKLPTVIEEKRLALSKTKSLISITNKVLVNYNWINRLWAWADKNDILNLQWIEDETQTDRGYWKGLPRDKNELLNLKSLNLKKVVFSELSKEIGNLIELERFCLRDNQLTSLPTEIGNLKNLTKLCLGNNQLKSLPKEIGNLLLLKELQVMKNQLIELPKEIGKLKSLKKLALWDNKLDLLPKEIVNLSNLQELHLFYNSKLRLTEEQKEWIGKLQKKGCDVIIDKMLMQLTLEEKKSKEIIMCNLYDEAYFQYLEEKVEDLELYEFEQNLIEIDRISQELIEENILDESWIKRLWAWADKNDISETNLYHHVGEDTIYGLHDICCRIHFHGNVIESKKEEDIRLIDEILECAYNVSNYDVTSAPCISILYTGIARNKELLLESTILDLSDSNLKEFSKDIFLLKSIEILVLDGNKLKKLSKEISNFINLNELSLANNQLKFLPKEIGSLTNLTWLDLEKNELKELPKEISNLTNLTWLNLNDNPNLQLSEEQKIWILNLKENVYMDDDLLNRNNYDEIPF